MLLKLIYCYHYYYYHYYYYCCCFIIIIVIVTVIVIVIVIVITKTLSSILVRRKSFQPSDAPEMQTDILWGQSQELPRSGSLPFVYLFLFTSALKSGCVLVTWWIFFLSLSFKNKIFVEIIFLKIYF